MIELRKLLSSYIWVEHITKLGKSKEKSYDFSFYILLISICYLWWARLSPFCRESGLFRSPKPVTKSPLVGHSSSEESGTVWSRSPRVGVGDFPSKGWVLLLPFLTVSVEYQYHFTPPKFNSSPLKSYRTPKGNSLPSIIFQGLC